MTNETPTPTGQPGAAPPEPRTSQSVRHWRVFNLALAIIIFDQATKLLVLKYLGFEKSRTVIDGFFELVHWGNTGAAWSMFTGYNGMLAVVAGLALVGLFFARHHFSIHTLGGQISLGLIFGGIAGNLIDRVRVGHVVDFLHFYVYRRDGHIAGFPAFNVADSAICVGVGLLFLLSWQSGNTPEATSESRTEPSTKPISSRANPNIRREP